MATRKYPKPKGLRLIDQYIVLMRFYPEAKCSVRSNTLFWNGYLCPTPLSRTYNIKVLYSLRRRPKVILVGDNLIGLDRVNFPHKFHIDEHKNEVDICLHLAHEFRANMRIADTIIPWAVEWLYFYEIWLATDEWCGGWHSSKNKEEVGNNLE